MVDDRHQAHEEDRGHASEELDVPGDGVARAGVTAVLVQVDVPEGVVARLTQRPGVAVLALIVDAVQLVVGAQQDQRGLLILAPVAVPDADDLAVLAFHVLGDAVQALEMLALLRGGVLAWTALLAQVVLGELFSGQAAAIVEVDPSPVVGCCTSQTE